MAKAERPTKRHYERLRFEHQGATVVTAFCGATNDLALLVRLQELADRDCMRCLRGMRLKMGDAFVTEKGLPLLGPLSGYGSDRAEPAEA